MKKTRILLGLLFSFILCGCEESNTTVQQTPKGGKVITENGMFVMVKELSEFEYKGHTYISCEVRGGLSLTHAGHCWCYTKKH